MPTVALESNEWGQVMAILATAPWRDANPLLMKIGNQLQQQALPSADLMRQGEKISPAGNGQEIEHGK
jgi:hypothetical protein